MNEKRSFRFLIVDDSPSMRHTIKEALMDLFFYQIEEVSSAEEAWGRLQTENFDLLLLDWDMPGMSGLELLQQIRAEDDLKEQAVFMVTSEGDHETVLKAIQAGTNDFIIKPFDIFDLSTKIERIFDKART